MVETVPLAARALVWQGLWHGLWQGLMRPVVRVVNGALKLLVDLLYPPVCLACNCATGSALALCALCWKQMRFIERPFCEVLGTPLASDYGGAMLSPEAFANPPVFSKARAAVLYGKGASRRLVHRLKYHDRHEGVLPMARWMARAGAEILRDADLIIPMPLHPRRLLARRYNQASELAYGVGQLSGVPVAPCVLRRLKATHSQIGMTRLERAANVNGAFGVDKYLSPLVAHKRIVLVDDVLTSGATANAASRALIRAGAKDVCILVFARVMREGAVF